MDAMNYVIQVLITYRICCACGERRQRRRRITAKHNRAVYQLQPEAFQLFDRRLRDGDDRRARPSPQP